MLHVQCSIRISGEKVVSEAATKIIVPYNDIESVRLPVLNALANMIPVVFDKAANSLEGSK